MRVQLPQGGDLAGWLGGKSEKGQVDVQILSSCYAVITVKLASFFEFFLTIHSLKSH